MKFYFSIILLLAYVQYVHNKSVKYQISSTQTLRQVNFTRHALYSHAKATSQEEQRELTVTELTCRPLVFFTTTSHQYQHLCIYFSEYLAQI